MFVCITLELVFTINGVLLRAELVRCDKTSIVAELEVGRHIWLKGHTFKTLKLPSLSLSYKLQLLSLSQSPQH